MYIYIQVPTQFRMNGIGLDYTKMLLREGASVVMTDIDSDRRCGPGQSHGWGTRSMC